MEDNSSTFYKGVCQLNYEQNVYDAIAILPHLHTGLDVNVKFTGVQDFEYTPECIIFDLLNIPLYHGWLVDPQAQETVKSLGNLGYNQLVENIVINKDSTDSELFSRAVIAEEFLEKTASQLTYHGLCELNSALRNDELAVFFRNNHFSTIVKKKSSSSHPRCFVKRVNIFCKLFTYVRQFTTAMG
ncbi:unnamed protein product, partial [Timema podura]|nr:unnamed protein product [Timema podura]